jgi:flagellar basal-body rod protein FlgG
MALSALHAAASGMRALDTALNVTANNLANINTVGFKRSRTNFEDLLYQAKREPGVPNVDDVPSPHGILVGLGSKVSGTQLDFTTTSVVEGVKTDLAIEGEGFFQVQALHDGEQITAYTRAGNFVVNRDGEMVLGNSVGSPMEPPVSIPLDAERDSLRVNERGEVFVRVGGTDTQVGQITLARFVNPEGLLSTGKNLFIATEASGEPLEGNPGEDALGLIQQGFLEQSNVDPIKELISLIFTQRAFELNSQTIQSAEQTLQIVANIRR